MNDITEALDLAIGRSRVENAALEALEHIRAADSILEEAGIPMRRAREKLAAAKASIQTEAGFAPSPKAGVFKKRYSYIIYEANDRYELPIFSGKTVEDLSSFIGTDTSKAYDALWNCANRKGTIQIAGKACKIEFVHD
jgi:hypothetical protein